MKFSAGTYILFLIMCLTWAWAIWMMTQPEPAWINAPDAKLKLDQLTERVNNLERHSKINSLLMPGFDEHSNLLSTTATITSYNPLESQCDDTPLINSSLKMVMPGQVALPQGMRKKLGIELGQHMIVGEWGIFQVTDHMNSRYDEENRVDIISFIPKWSKKFGVKPDVTIYWWN